MCGFVVSTEGNNIDDMLDAQRFRGPDARGETIRYFNALTWSHVLLDISGEKEVQPYITSKGNIMVFNGEMYDSNIPNDTKFLADGYEKYGFKFIEFTNWHGSFCYMDYKKGICDIVRDHFGTKPLWMRREKNKGISITTSLASFKDSKAEPLTDKFLGNAIWIGKNSPFEGVRKVEPGQLYHYNIASGVLKRGLNLWGGYRIENNPFNPEQFKTELIKGIRKVAKNKQKTAIFLSGGLDSTCALGVVKDMGLDLTAYICAYSDEKGDMYRQEIFADESKLELRLVKSGEFHIK